MKNIKTLANEVIAQVQFGASESDIIQLLHDEMTRFAEDYHNKQLMKVTLTNKCNCPEDKLRHFIDTNSYPYGDTVEYDQCTICGKTYNTHVK